jgi:hypothetical protein
MQQLCVSIAEEIVRCGLTEGTRWNSAATFSRATLETLRVEEQKRRAGDGKTRPAEFAALPHLAALALPFHL